MSGRDSTQSENEALAEAVAAALDAWLPEPLIEAGVPGAAVSVVGDGGVVWQETYGRLDHPGSPQINSETLFCVRSLAKGVTAIAVLTAVQDGLLDLDVPIKEYLPDFTVHSRFDSKPEERITLRHLLAHWAGFTHDEPPGNDPNHPDLFEKHIQSISDTWLRFPVGHRYAYTNLDYDLAGHILQIRSGMPFAQYVKERVFIPVGMTSSSFDPEEIERCVNRAIGHKSSGRIEPLRFPEIPAAGLYANLLDMAKYVRFHLGGGDATLLRRDLMEHLHTLQFARPNQETGYCFGLHRQLVSHTFSISHAGGGRGFQSRMILFPELGFGVLMLTNKADHGLTLLPLQKIIDDLISERFGPNPAIESNLENMEELSPDDPRIQSVLGRYWESDHWTIGREDGVIGLRIHAQDFHPLTFYADAGELVGFDGTSKEIRFIPSFGDQPATMVSIDRRLLNSDFRAFNDG
ncbi:MAG: serine hydrolase domain-containing protein, partial [Anaerolineales bacterium]